MHQIPGSAAALLRLPPVMSITGLPKSSLYSLMGQGRFPKPVKISARAVAWPSSVVDECISAWTEASQH